jgi:glyoxylase-like metal-dependent hydrolase (beta-lactamase superfamily II)
MRRVFVLGIIVMASVLATAWTNLKAQQPAAGQGREGGAGRGAAAGVGAIQKVAGNVYVIPRGRWKYRGLCHREHGLPDRTYKDRLTLLRGDESIDLFYFGKAHTDGDTFVLFRNARVLHTGDAFANRGQPNIDLMNSGSGVAYPDTLAKAASTIKNVDTIIAGHNAALLKHEDLVNQAEFTRLMLTKAREAVKAGKTPEQAMMEFQAALPATFKDYNLAPGRGGPGGAFVPLFEELKQSK